MLALKHMQSYTLILHSFKTHNLLPILILIYMIIFAYIFIIIADIIIIKVWDRLELLCFYSFCTIHFTCIWQYSVMSSWLLHLFICVFVDGCWWKCGFFSVDYLLLIYIFTCILQYYCNLLLMWSRNNQYYI